MQSIKQRIVVASFALNVKFRAQNNIPEKALNNISKVEFSFIHLSLTTIIAKCFTFKNQGTIEI